MSQTSTQANVLNILNNGLVRLGIIGSICLFCICPFCLASQGVISAITATEGEANYIGGALLFLLSLVGTIITIVFYSFAVRVDFGLIIIAAVAVLVGGLAGLLLEIAQSGAGINLMMVENVLGWTILAFAAGYKFFGKKKQV